MYVAKNDFIVPLCQVTLSANSCSAYKSKVMYCIYFADDVINTILLLLIFLECAYVKCMLKNSLRTLPLAISTFKLVRIRDFASLSTWVFDVTLICSIKCLFLGS